jgi:hypothetical protein
MEHLFEGGEGVAESMEQCRSAWSRDRDAVSPADVPQVALPVVVAPDGGRDDPLGAGRVAAGRIDAPRPALWGHPATFPRPGASTREVVEALEDVSVCDVPDAALVDLVVGWQQVVGLAVASQAHVVRELLARGYGFSSGLPEELGAALAWTTRSSQAMVARAEQLGALPAVEAGLRDGALDTRKVDLLLDELAALSVGTEALVDQAAVEEACERVSAVAVERGADLTTTQLRRVLRRELIAVDAAVTHERVVRARADRSVQVEWAPDGMAWVSAFLPAPDAMVVRTVLDAAADASASVLDDRTADQRRADAFVSIFTTIADTGVLPCGEHLPVRRGTRPHIQVTVAASTLLGLDEAPAELAGFGPIPAGVARQIATDGTWRRLLTDAQDGTLVERGSTTYRPGAVLGAHVIARDVVCTFPGCVRTAKNCELDHIEPYRTGQTNRPQTRADNLHAVCKHHHDLKTEGHWKVRRDIVGGGVVWTSRAGLTYAIHPEPVLASPATWKHAPHEPPDANPPPF